jgi:predicted O-methyltransferase YrrM
MNGHGPDPTPLIELSVANWGAQILFTANRLGLFETCAKGPQSVEDIASTLDLHKRPTRLFLNACVSLGLLEKSTEGYVNSQLADVFLNQGGPGYMGNAIRYSDNLYDAWGQLEQTLRTDVPAMAPEIYLGEDRDKTRDFVHAMHDRATGTARALVHLVDLEGRRRMLDIGGGPGTYSALFAEQYPQLHSTIIDLPGVAEIGAEIVASMGFADRIDIEPGSYREIDWPDGMDIVLISGVFHRESEQTCRELIGRARASLADDGLLIVSDVFTNEDHAGPTLAALFGITMMLTAPDGGIHSDADVRAWMEEDGFEATQMRPFPAPMPHRVVTGIKHRES